MVVIPLTVLFMKNDHRLSLSEPFLLVVVNRKDSIGEDEMFVSLGMQFFLYSLRYEVAHSSGK